MNRATLTCKLKGHLWRSPAPTPKPDTATGSYWIHLRCFRCGLYRKEQRQAVPFMSEEQ